MPEASAPGKLIIVGEYAVLEGAPAIATAVDVRAHASVQPNDQAQSLFVDPFLDGDFRFRLDARYGLEWLDGSPGQSGAIVEAAASALRGRLPSPAPCVTIALDSDAFHDTVDGRSLKLGIGSSAAVLVALVGALVAAMRIPPDSVDMLSLCRDAHRRFQGGQGSGVDIATAIAGGTVSFRSTGSELPAAHPLDWPEGLLMLPVWSGESASTPKLVARFNEYRQRAPDEFQAHVRKLAGIAEAAHEAWLSHSLEKIIGAFRAYDAALLTLDRESEIGINTAAHDTLRRLSERYGVAYKTSGAGGGDFGIALTDSGTAFGALRRAFVSAGYRVLEGGMHAAGLTVSAG